MALHHANRGRVWQQAVEDQHVEYARAGRCAWIRNEPTRTSAWTTATAAEDAVQRGRGAPDYTVFCRHRSLLVETKDHQGERWPLTEVSYWQATRMDGLLEHADGVFVFLRLGGRYLLVPWEAITLRWHARHGLGDRLTTKDDAVVEVYSTDYLDCALSMLTSPLR